MNIFFGELYDAYIQQVQTAKRKNEDAPNMLWTIKPEHLRVLLNDEGAFHYMGHAQYRTIFDIPFVESDNQLSAWVLWTMADEQS